jgi:acyl-CoA thioesterase
MGAFKNLEEVKNHFQNDRFATSNGAEVVEFNDDLCVCEMKLDDRHKNAYGGVMGGAIFTLADLAFAVMCNNDHQLTVALDVNIHFLSAPKGQKLIAKASRIKSGKTTGVYSVEVSDDTGRQVAMFLGTGYKL